MPFTLRNNLRNIFIAIAVILPSFAFFPLYFYLLLFPLVFNYYLKIDYNWLIIGTIIFLSVLNQILNANELLQDFKIGSIIPYAIFMFISYYFALKVNKAILYFILLFILFEVFIGVFEYVMEVKSFFPSVLAKIQGEAPFGMRGLIYYKRVAGLSSNSSVFGYKILVGVFILHFLKITGKKKFIFLSILLIGIFITFTRSVMLSLAVFIVLINISTIKDAIIKLFLNRSTLTYIIYGLVFIGLIYITLYNWDLIYNQLNRGMRTADLSSRDLVFKTFFQFLKDNVFFGNGSYKLWMNIDGDRYHAHNSIMQTLVTNGIIIGFFYIVLIFRNINRQNLPYILTFLVASLFQYIILWGVSFMDLMFFTFLLIKSNKSMLNETN